MGYVRELRSLVGHRPIILPGAAALIVNPQGELLLFCRSDNGCWGPPGGMMEPGETLEETARRETREETGMELGSLTLYDVFSGPDLFYVYPNGDQVYNVSVVYVTHEYKGEARIDQDEGRECGFFPLAELPHPLSPPIEQILLQFAASFIKSASDRQ